MIPPSDWVLRHLARIPKGRPVLDLACGRGRHVRLLVAQNHPVLAVDRDESALSGLAGFPGVEVACLDLEGDEWPLSGLTFAGVIVTNYLWRPRFNEVFALLAPGGVLIYETFMVGNGAFGKPSRPDFLLQPGELRRAVVQAGLHEIAFEEGYAAHPKPCMRQAIVAERPAI